MNLIELQKALRQLRLGGIAEVLETRLHQAQSEAMAPIDLISSLVSDELARRSTRLLERRRKQAQFRDPQKTLQDFDFTFNKKMNRGLGKCANLSWKLKRLQTLWFDGIGRNNIKPVRERSRDEESVTFGEKTQEEASTG